MFRCSAWLMRVTGSARIRKLRDQPNQIDCRRYLSAESKAYLDSVYAYLVSNGAKTLWDIGTNVKKPPGLGKLSNVLKTDPRFRQGENQTVYVISEHNSDKTQGESEYQSIITIPKFESRSSSQKKFMKNLESEGNIVVVGVGSAGTGKTWTACYAAAKMLKEGRTKRIILTRPVVTTDEDLGFLPGDIKTKMYPWILPIREILLTFMSNKTLDNLLEEGVIEISPLAYMRGRTFENCWIIGDELQNTTKNQMLMLLTRIGKKCKLVVTGDPLQSDLALSTNGLSHFVSRIRNSSIVIPQIAVTEFSTEDVQRHPVVSKILLLYDESPENSKTGQATSQPQERTHKTTENVDVRIVDTKQGLIEMLSALSANLKHAAASLDEQPKFSWAMALDLEGISLGAHGEICLVQIVSGCSRSTVYLIDVIVLGSAAFSERCTYDGKVTSFPGLTWS